MLALKIRKNRGDILFDIINTILLTMAMLIVLYPLYFIFIASFSDPNAVYEGKVVLLPKNQTFDGYRRLFAEQSIWIGYANTLLYTTTGTLINVVLTLAAAFPLSRRDFVGKKLFMALITFTMFFSGGLIPEYLLVQKLDIINSMWALILPVAVVPWNLFIAKSFFQTSIPEELCEAAYIDGSSHFRLFARIVLPLSKALISVMVLFYAIGHWNSFFSAMLYITDEKKYPLQLILRNILIVNQVSSDMIVDQNSVAEKQKVADLLKYGVIIVSSIPVLILYPFVQKYFVQGVMIGAIKG